MESGHIHKQQYKQSGLKSRDDGKRQKKACHPDIEGRQRRCMMEIAECTRRGGRKKKERGQTLANYVRSN